MTEFAALAQLTVVAMVPYLLASLGTMLGGLAGVFSVSQEGVMLLGASVMTWAFSTFKPVTITLVRMTGSPRHAAGCLGSGSKSRTSSRGRAAERHSASGPPRSSTSCSAKPIQGSSTRCRQASSPEARLRCWRAHYANPSPGESRTAPCLPNFHDGIVLA